MPRRLSLRTAKHTRTRRHARWVKTENPARCVAAASLRTRPLTRHAQVNES